jgi:hypothetical protein
MSHENQPPAAPTYSPEFYDEGYYRRGERCGFKGYDYHSPDQKQQLAIKWDACRGVVHGSALFIGCALGHEVAHWIKNGKQAFGLDVSRYAIENQIPEAKSRCHLYDGAQIREQDDSVDLVASFDVLTHIPDKMLADLTDEMVRVARRGIVFRTIVKNWRNLGENVDFQDGCWGRYLRFDHWDHLITRTGKFYLSEAHTTRDNYETTFTFLRK